MYPKYRNIITTVPIIISIFVNASTIRLWNVHNKKQQIEVIKSKDKQGMVHLQ